MPVLLSHSAKTYPLMFLHNMLKAPKKKTPCVLECNNGHNCQFKRGQNQHTNNNFLNIIPTIDPFVSGDRQWNSPIDLK